MLKQNPKVEEPYAGDPLVRVCEGGRMKVLSLLGASIAEKRDFTTNFHLFSLIRNLNKKHAKLAKPLRQAQGGKDNVAVFSFGSTRAKNSATVLRRNREQ